MDNNLLKLEHSGSSKYHQIKLGFGNNPDPGIVTISSRGGDLFPEVAGMKCSCESQKCPEPGSSKVTPFSTQNTV